MDSVSIRPYQSIDREAVRRICCETGDKGGPCDSFFPDRALFADMWTAYYTDYEPENCWVVDQDGLVKGYLLSSLNETAFRFRQFGWILPRAALRAFLRGTFFSKRMQLLIWRNLFSPKAGREKILQPLPGQRGHLHINLAKDVRGQKIGERLIVTCLKKAAGKVTWMTAGVRADNVLSQQFFEKQNFRKVAERTGFVIPGRSGYRIFIIEYAYLLER